MTDYGQSGFVNEPFGPQPRPFVYLLSTAALQLQSRVVATETLHSMPKEFPIWPFTEKVCPNSCIECVGISGIQQGEITPAGTLQEGFIEGLELCLEDFQGLFREDGVGEGIPGKEGLRLWQFLGESLTEGRDYLNRNRWKDGGTD